MSRVLVTGATGFLGRYVCQALSSAGRKLVELHRSGSRGPTSIVCDLERDAEVTLPGAFSEVYHVAGLAHTVARSESERRRFFAVNQDGTRKLLAALDGSESLPQAFVQVSTVAVYGLEHGTNLDETTPRRASDPYGASKKAAEDLVMDWCDRRGVRGGIVRLPLVVGRCAPGNLKAMARAIETSRYFGVGPGTARRSMVYAADVGTILPAIAQTGGIYHLTDGRHPSFAEIEATVACLLHRRQPMHLPLGAARLAAVVCDAAELVLRHSLPFSTRVLTKMTSSLTFSDQKARSVLGWLPSAALDHFGDLMACG